MPAKVEIGPIMKVTKTDDEWKKLLSLAARPNHSISPFPFLYSPSSDRR
jgi:hypothetical protein